MRLLPVFLVACACAPPPPRPPTPTPALSLTPTPTLSPTQTPAPTLAARHKTAYAEATRLASRGDFHAALQALAPIADATAKTRDDKLAYWIHNEETWLYWAQGQLAGALAETMRGASALDRSTLDADAIASMRLHTLWDAAYLLADLGDPSAVRARADYEALAKPRNDHDGMAVLEAFFMVKLKKGAEALAAAKRVDVEKDDDLQDLYVIALAFDAGGDAENARKVRMRICAGNEYLMKPLITSRMLAEGFHCPRRE